jgi:hypothetical protein
MTHRFKRVRSAVVGLCLLGGAMGAPSLATPLVKDTPEPLIRHDVSPPSADFTTYIEGELIRVSIPSNWRELPGSNAVTFAPEGAYGNFGIKSVFTHGLRMGLARNDKRNLQITTDDYIAAYVLAPPHPGRTFRYRNVTIGDRPGLRTVLFTVSEPTGEPEQIVVFTTLLRDSTLLYVLAVTPRDRVSHYAATFRRILGSISILDCDGCVGFRRSARDGRWFDGPFNALPLPTPSRIRLVPPAPPGR